MKGVSEDCECIELRSTFQNYTTVISSMEISANNCSPYKLNHGKKDAGEAVADLGFHEGWFIRSGALVRPQNFLQTMPSFGQNHALLRS